MSDSILIEKANVLLEALPYIQKFRGSIFVIKYGGSFMDDPNPQVRASVAQDIVFLASVGIQTVVVHGGGKAITRAMERAGLKSEWRGGMRVTDEATVKVVEQTLNNEINAEICDIISKQGGMAKGIPGNVVSLCEKLHAVSPTGEPVDIGFVGDIKFVRTKIIKKALADGYIPVISPIALGEDDHPYNTNADVAAAAVAGSLKARRLVFMSDVPGLLANPAEPGSLIPTLPVSDVARLKADGVISSGMIPKVDSGVKALQSGVKRVHFIDGRVRHSLLLEIFTDRGIGTEIVHDEQAALLLAAQRHENGGAV
ncbi:MAG: acetylglutamate kinase [Puniceicoccales bacterium]|jgi:acetylglutamate kinase|nr:acetylglutamate kinase [Puniceicoccales bacterium]